MIPCRICEKTVPADKLEPHSAKCIEVTEIRELLRSIVNKMDKHGEKAMHMRNSVETYVAKKQL